MGSKSTCDRVFAGSQCLHTKAARAVQPFLNSFVNVTTCLIQFLMHFYNKGQRVVVKTEGLGGSGLPEAVVCGRGRSSGGLGRPSRQSSWPRGLAVWLPGATQGQLETESVAHLRKEFLVCIDSVSYRVPDAIGACTVFSLGLAPCWKRGFA